MNRREALTAIAGATTAALASTNAAHADDAPTKSGLGLITYCASQRRDLLRKQQPGFDLFAPHNFLTHCQSIGAAGMQAPLEKLSDAEAEDLRAKAAAAGMYVEASIQPPQSREDVERFDKEMQTAARCGALAARTVIIPGRRYEYFDSLEHFREFAERGRRSLELAAPIAEKHRVPLAVENHKEHRNEERLALFAHISSEFVGACVDTGNSVSLLEDPIETIEAFAPWAFSVHFKDQILAEYEDGFLLGDIPLGGGAFDLPKMIEILRSKKPDIRLTLEIITRDPLKVPCLSEKYWATFGGLPGIHLSRTLRHVREHAAKDLPYVSTLSPAEQVAREDANVRASLDYARDQLGQGKK